MWTGLSCAQPAASIDLWEVHQEWSTRSGMMTRGCTAAKLCRLPFNSNAMASWHEDDLLLFSHHRTSQR